MWIKELCLRGFRGLNGCVEFGSRLNIVAGLNCSGKAAVVEALAYLLALSYSNLRGSHGYLALLHAARGSHNHSVASLIHDSGSALGTLSTGDGEERARAVLEGRAVRSFPNQ